MACISCLPDEIFLMVAGYLHRRDVAHFRLTCKRFEPAGRLTLFEHFTLYISNTEPLQLLQSPRLLDCIKNLDLWIHHDSFEHVAVNIFQHISGLSGLNFDAPYGANQSRILQSVFVELHTKPTVLRRLNIRIRFANDSPPHGFSDDEATVAVLQGVHHLYLHPEPYFERDNRTRLLGPNQRVGKPCSAWISPHFINIRSLVLDFGSGWLAAAGVHPKLDFGTTYFPHLYYFSLSHFIIYHEWFVNWLVKHDSKLEMLDFAFTPILWKEYSIPQFDASVTHSERRRVFPRTWAEMFDILVEKFPKLSSFSLIYYAGHVKEVSEGDLEVFDGMYTTTDYSVKALLPADEVGARRLAGKVGKGNFRLEAERDLGIDALNRVEDVDTSDGFSSINSCFLDQLSEDSYGNIFTTATLPQLSVRDEEDYGN